MFVLPSLDCARHLCMRDFQGFTKAGQDDSGVYFFQLAVLA